MFGSKGKGSIDDSFLRNGETLASAGEEKLVDGYIGCSGVLGVVGGKCDL